MAAKITIAEIKDLVSRTFLNRSNLQIVRKPYHDVYKMLVGELDLAENPKALRMVCHGKYFSEQVAFMQINDDFSSGFALTVDSFCTGGKIGNNIIPYMKIKSVSFDDKTTSLYIEQFDEDKICLSSFNRNESHDCDACRQLFDNISYIQIKNFLEVAKNF